MDFYEVMEKASTKRLLSYLKKHRLELLDFEDYLRSDQVWRDRCDKVSFVKELLSKREHIEKEN